MRPVELSELKNIAEYELERPEWRTQVLALKERRRIEVGEHITFLFENRETLRYQIQEMMRIERMVKPEDIAHELETYNELIPKPGELSATMLIAYPSAEERDVMLRKLLGLEDHVWVEVAGAARSKARFDTRQIATDRISSVQYVKFPLSQDQVQRWKDGVKFLVDHPNYHAERALSKAELEELAGDLA